MSSNNPKFRQLVCLSVWDTRSLPPVAEANDPVRVIGGVLPEEADKYVVDVASRVLITLQKQTGYRGAGQHVPPSEQVEAFTQCTSDTRRYMFPRLRMSDLVCVRFRAARRRFVRCRWLDGQLRVFFLVSATAPLVSSCARLPRRRSGSWTRIPT